LAELTPYEKHWYKEGPIRGTLNYWGEAATDTWKSLSGAATDAWKSYRARKADSEDTPEPDKSTKPAKETVLSRYQKEFGPVEGTRRYLVQRFSSNMYIVQEDDSLFAIVEKTYGNGTEWKKLAELNGLDQETGMINPGDELILPLPRTPKRMRTIFRRGTEYIVAKGDTLYDIADRFYSDGSKWQGLAEINDLDLATGMVNSGDVLFIPKRIKSNPESKQ